MKTAAKTITKIVDTVQVFPCWEDTSNVKCQVRIYKLDYVSFSMNVVLISQVAEESAYTSITNGVEDVATRLAKEHDLPLNPLRVCWIEHYPPGMAGNPYHRFSEVSLEWKSDEDRMGDPRWRFMLPEEVALLTGEVFEEPALSFLRLH
jgi:hypothetical protein